MMLVKKYFKNSPTKTGAWAFGLSLVGLFSGPILGLFAAVIAPILSSILGEKTSQITGFMFGILIVLSVITSFCLSIKSFRSNDRSWMVWFALIFSSFGILFFIFLLLGEFLLSP